MIELYWYQFLILFSFAVCCGYFTACLMASAAKADNMDTYWAQVAFMARSIMTDEQKDKLEKLMEAK